MASHESVEEAGALSTELEAWVQSERRRLIDEWRECCQIPSVSSEDERACAQMAAWLEHRASPLFDELRRLDGAPAPILLGVLHGERGARLLSYTHYDVVPAGQRWTTEPFGADIKEGAVYARGCGDDKADVMARLHALEAWRAVRGRLPFTVLWLSEGMEEVGSPGLARAIAANRRLLAADACLWESYYRSIDGHRPTIGFGCRGVLNVELSVRLLSSDTHSAMAGIFRSAAAVLAHALASLVDSQGRVLIPGFYDDVSLPSAEDRRLAKGSPPPPGLSAPWSRGALRRGSPRARTERWLYEPTLNIASMHAGPDLGEREAVVLPGQARARLDMRLVPHQDPKLILDQLRSHLAREGLREVKLRLHNAIPPTRSPMDGPLADAVKRAARECFHGADPVLHPIVPGSGPLHLFTGPSGMPTVMPPGTIRPDGGMHGPDENVRVNHYLDTVRMTLRIFELLGRDERFSIKSAIR